MDETTQPTRDRSAERPGHPRRWSILAALCAALLLVVVDNTVLHVALPALGRAFDASIGDLQGVLESYVVAFAGLLITAGVLADRYGRRRVLLVGLLVFGAASALAAAAPGIGWLVAARAAMGVGAALVMPSTLAVLVDVFPPGERARAFAVWSAVAAVAMAGGPLLGGALVDAWSWAGVFLVNVPVVAVAWVGVVRLVPESHGDRARRLDLAGVMLLTAGLGAVVLAVVEVPERGADARVLGSGALGCVLLAVFAARTRRVAYPLVDLGLYRDRRFSGASFAVAVLTVATGSILFVLAQYLQLVLGLGAFETGLAAVPLAAGVVVGSFFGGRAPRRFGERACIVGGFAVTAAGFAVLATLGTGSPLAAVGAGLALAGLGSGFGGPAATSAVLGAVPPERAGAGAALNDTHQQLGIALGVALLGSLLAAVYRVRLPEGVPDGARSSLAATLSHTSHAGDAELASAARAAFVGAQSTVLWTTVAVALAGACVALLTMREPRA